MTKRDLDDFELDDLFAAARGQDPSPSGDLMDRVLADALAVQAAEPVTTSRPGIWAGLLAALGGWPSLAGLATAGVAGLWIGISPPEGLSDSAEALFSVDTDLYLVDVATGLSFEFGEG